MTFNKYPYTDFHEMNLDWIMDEIKKMHSDWDDFKVINQIRFYGNWDINSSYPAWALVSVDNIGYISKKPVPAGMPITEIDYWAPVADYSALLADMQQRIVMLERRFEELKDDPWIIISDSYGTTYGNDIGDELTIFDRMRAITGRSETDLRGFGYSGCGFINRAGGGTFLELFTASSASIPNKEKIKKIAVIAGRNDYIASISEIETAISSFVSFCKSTYPNAKVYLGFIANGDNSSAGTREQQMNVYYAFKNCQNYGAIYLDGVEAIIKDWGSFMYNDGIHPNSNGKKAIAQYCVEALETGHCSVSYDIATHYAGLLFNTAQGVSQSGLANGIIFTYDNNQIHMRTAAIGIVNVPQQSIVGASLKTVNIGTMGPLTPVKHPLSELVLPCVVRVFQNDTYTGVEGNLIIKTNGDLDVFFYNSSSITFNKFVVTFAPATSIPAVLG